MAVSLAFLRFLVAWAYTVLIASLCFVCTPAAPRWSWTFFRRKWGMGVLWLVGVRVHIEGAERMQGPAVFISNHESLIDVAILPAWLPAKLKFVAKKELVRVPFWGWALAAAGALMIDRSNPLGAIAAIREGLRKMPPDWSVAVFPEGTRSRDGVMGRFKKGAFHIAMEMKVPVIPLGLAGARDVVPKGGWLVRPTQVHLVVGEPIPTHTWTPDRIGEYVAQGRAAVLECVERARARRARELSAAPATTQRASA
ncbi:MAG: 1-acyl-sn-glycerol-3-phosphate acyltransferase [Deltaproteobacteria bacterium]|nr:1-acyl-sn-glycerol-3-phosphate acyltransferase [Deltaproteobacteria bacterium]